MASRGTPDRPHRPGPPPGCHQDATQAVMGVGPAGRLLDEALADAGIDSARVYTTNAVKHFRFQGTRGKQRIHKSPVLRSRERDRDRALLVADLSVAATALHPT